MQGQVLAIARRAASRAPMEELEATRVSVEAGVEGDMRGEPGDRQVTILTREGWDAACAELGRELPWTTRRSNILIENLRVEGRLGRSIRIGDVELSITGETDPCSRMEEQAAGLRQALAVDWRGGVTCRVARGGSVKVGDRVEFLS